MATLVFANETTNIVSSTHLVNGLLQVDIAGNLGGADVITSYLMNDGTLVPIRTCSWLTSDGDILPNGADGGLQQINNRNICFSIINVGEDTDITLEFDVE